MENFKLSQIKLTDGFFKDRQDINLSATLKSVYHRFQETGRFKALKCKAEEPKAHIFWDSDIAKWLEGVACALARAEDEELRAWYEETVTDIISNQREDGYFNSYFQVYEPEAIFTRMDDHELYCAGHLFEAAVTAKENLGDDRLLQFASRYTDYIYDRFVVKQDTGFKVPGHEEIELALFRLYGLTKDEKYKTLAAHFLNLRGTENNQFTGLQRQTHLPIREQTEAEGHAVRALYLYTAMADMAKEYGDKAMQDACEKLFDDITLKKMYITGGTGSSYHGEKFTSVYDLPNFRSYAETCASIALTYFADRMMRLTGEAKYAHAVERALFNGVISGISLDGKSFFYVNPLEVQSARVRYFTAHGGKRMPLFKRVAVFDCSCCPPNLCRIFEELPQYIWYTDEEKNSLTVAQYISSKLTSEFADAELVSGFPYDGKVRLKINSHGKKITVRMRKPEWCDTTFTNEQDGYLVYEGIFAGEEIAVEFPIGLREVYANQNIYEAAGKRAFTYGPLVLCAEGTDNPFPLFAVKVADGKQGKVTVDKNSPYILNATMPATYLDLGGKLYASTGEEKSVTITLIPYFAWANREENDMRVWF